MGSEIWWLVVACVVAQVMPLQARRFSVRGMADAGSKPAQKKHDDSLSLIGVNTILPKGRAGDIVTEIELIRSTEEENGQQIPNARVYQQRPNPLAEWRQGPRFLQKTGRERRNLFEALTDVVKAHSLGHISHVPQGVDGEYRRNMAYEMFRGAVDALFVRLKFARQAGREYAADKFFGHEFS